MPKQRFKITPSVYLVLMRDDKILLSRRYNTGYFDGYYSLPAGHLDGNETLKQAIAREAKEETGIVLNLEDLELAHAMNRMIPDNERVDFFFTAKKWQGKLNIMEPDKCDGLAWFKTDDLPKDIIPYIKQAIDFILHDTFYSEREGQEN